MSIVKNICFYLVVVMLFGCFNETREKIMPKEWFLDFKGKTIGDVSAIIGDPTDNASAKGYLYWVRDDGKWRHVLKFICSECSFDEKPSEIYYFLYKGGRSEPVNTFELLK